MKRLFFIILLTMFCYLSATQIDLNTASFQEIKTLPVSDQQAKDIFEYRYYISFYKNIYDLRKIPSIDQETMLKLKPLVSISHYTDLDMQSNDVKRFIIYWSV